MPLINWTTIKITENFQLRINQLGFSMLFKCRVVFLLFLSLFFSSNIQAREPLPPRFSASAYTGVYTVGQADLMLSLDGDQRHNLYVNPQGAYGTDQQWYGDLGLGYRWIKNDAAILGWYLFTGHSRVENSSGFWITNPGVEVMGSRWDARINAYIPVAGRSHEVGNVDYNIVSEPFFTGHTEVIVSEFNVANEIQQIGNGADARVGYQLFRYVPLKGYLGAYFFDIANTDTVRGGAAGLEYWFDDTIRVFANYSYDNYQHSKVIGGLGISFGGVRKHHADPSLSERLTDPVDRYLANLGHGSGIPSKTLLYGLGRGGSTQLINDNIAFFSQTGTPNTGGNLTLTECTFENPCGPIDFSQTGVDDLNNILPNTKFYFNGGTYPANNVVGPLTLNNGQSVSSRTADYSAPATDSARSTFAGGFNLSGNNQLENIIMTPSGQDTAVTSNGSNNQITGSDVGSANNRYLFGIEDQGTNTNIENTSIFVNSIGILSVGANTGIESSSVNVLNNGNATSAGISASSTDVVINNSTILVTGPTSTSNNGVRAVSDSVVALNNTTVSVENTGSGNAVALDNTNSEILTLEGSLSVDGVNPIIATGDPVDIGFGTVCMVNGVVQACP